MKKHLSKMCIWLVLFICPLFAKGHLSNEQNMARAGEEVKVTVSTEDLIVDEETIFINLDGVMYPVNSLIKDKNHWIAKIRPLVNYCPEGHPLCSKCSLCHLARCWYYVPPCWR